MGEKVNLGLSYLKGFCKYGNGNKLINKMIL